MPLFSFRHGLATTSAFIGILASACGSDDAQPSAASLDDASAAADHDAGALPSEGSTFSDATIVGEQLGIVDTDNPNDENDSAPTIAVEADANAAQLDGSVDSTTSSLDAAVDSTPSSLDAAVDGTTSSLDAGVDDAGPGPGPTQQCTVTADSNGFFKLTSAMSDYWVRLPPNYDAANPTPRILLVGLHGCGDSALNHATWAVVPSDLRVTQNYIGLSVGGRDGSCWATSGGPLITAAIAHVRSCFYVHQKRIVLSGYSSGGDLTLAFGLTHAAMFAGLLIEHSDLTQNFGASGVAPVLAGAAWKINMALAAHTEDAVYPVATVRSDRDKIIAAGFPLQYQELAGTHDGDSTEWSLFLIPKMANWLAP